MCICVRAATGANGKTKWRFCGADCLNLEPRKPGGGEQGVQLSCAGAGCEYLGGKRNGREFCKRSYGNLQEKEEPCESQGWDSDDNGGLADGAVRIAFCWSSNSWPGGTTDGRREEMQSQACSSGTDQRLLWMDALTVISGSV